LTGYDAGMLEKNIEAHLVKRVKEIGGMAYKFVSPAHRGVADRVVCLPNGVVWFVELKAPGGRLSPLQQVFEDDMVRLRQRYVCLWSKDQVDAWVKEL
jgi:hypothetical protein